MRIQMIKCDICGNEIPKIKKKDLFGIEREYYDAGCLDFGEPFTNIDPTILGIDLCKSCAEKYSERMMNFRRESSYMIA